MTDKQKVETNTWARIKISCKGTERGAGITAGLTFGVGIGVADVWIIIGVFWLESTLALASYLSVSTNFCIGVRTIWYGTAYTGTD